MGKVPAGGKSGFVTVLIVTEEAMEEITCPRQSLAGWASGLKNKRSGFAQSSTAI